MATRSGILFGLATRMRSTASSRRREIDSVTASCRSTRHSYYTGNLLHEGNFG